MSRRSLYLVHTALFAMAALWGGTFVAIRYLLTEMSPLALIGIRFLISAVIFAVFLAFTKRPKGPVPARDLLRILAASLTGIVVYQLALNFGELRVTAGTSSLIVALHPVITAVAAAFVLGEKITPRKAAGFSIAIGGLIVVVLLGSGHANLSGALKGILLVLVAPLAWSASTLMTKPLSGRYPAAWLTSWIMILGAVFMVPAMGTGAIHQALALSLHGWIAMIFLSLGATFLAYLFWYYGLQHLEAGKISIYVYLCPFFALIGGALLLGETLTSFSILGGALIVGGVALTNSR